MNNHNNNNNYNHNNIKAPTHVISLTNVLNNF